jgi:hypothetical protein
MNSAAVPVLCERSERFGRFTNTGRLYLFYSLKNRKFIKGYVKKVGWEILYRLTPGMYIRMSWEYWNKQDPPHVITVYLGKLECQGNNAVFRFESAAQIKFYNAEFLIQFPEQIRDLYMWRPGYHGVPSVNFDKIYSEEEHRRLIEFIRSNKLIIEGEENE